MGEGQPSHGAQSGCISVCSWFRRLRSAPLLTGAYGIRCAQFLPKLARPGSADLKVLCLPASAKLPSSPSRLPCALEVCSGLSHASKTSRRVRHWASLCALANEEGNTEAAGEGGLSLTPPLLQSSLSAGGRGGASAGRGRVRALEAELQRGKAFQRSTRFAGAGWGGIGGLVQRLPQKESENPLGSCYFSSDLEAGLSPSATMKRPCEETTSDSDMDETIDVGSENNYSGHSASSVIRSNSPTTTSQIMARKKRRGIIEKRRRDRINNSLSELRRLVPTAFEKQGSAKLEKAEILQMTVDHLKMLQATGGKGYFDVHTLAMDFISIGFRECLTEVARYLSSVEGLDTSDPLRVRLVSHLSSCASQREAAAMTSSMANHHHPLHPHHWAAAFHHLPTALLQQNGLHSSDISPCRLSTASELPPHGSALLTATFAHADSTLRVPSAGSVAPCVPPLSTSLLSLSATVHAAAAAAAQSFPLSFAGAFPMLPPNAAAAVAAATAISPPLSISATSSPQQVSGNGNSKPYRPWGTEVGAF